MEPNVITQPARRNANDNYKNYNGSDTFHKHWLGFIYTEGVRDLAADYGAFWFIDIVASYRTHKKVRAEGFQVWKLKRVKDDQFIAICEDGNDNIVITQKISFSDFKDDDLTFWCIDGVIMLPSEY